MKQRTTSYIATVKMINGQVAPEDQAILESIRNTVKISNKMTGKKQYVKLQGRLGEDNPNAWKYRSGSWKNGGYSNCQSVRLPDAQRADVYIYER
jgi:hypothetical protein